MNNLTANEIILILNSRLNNLKDTVPMRNNEGDIKIKMQRIETALKELKVKLRLYEEE